jgi:hypothetical protein
LLDLDTKGFTFSQPYTAAQISLPLYIHAEELLRLPLPGLLFFANSRCTPMGLVNDARGIATGVVVDPSRYVFPMQMAEYMPT